MIEAGGIPRGAVTAADCNFTASGQVTGDRFEGQVMHMDRDRNSDMVAPGSAIAIAFMPGAATVTEAKVRRSVPDRGRCVGPLYEEAHVMRFSFALAVM